MKCQDCGREMPMAASESIEGWLMFDTQYGRQAMCPTCVRLAAAEKAIKDCQELAARLLKQVEILVGALGQAPSV